MIKTKDRKRLKKAIGAKHFIKLDAFIKDKKIKTIKGNDFSKSYIQKVFYGTEENESVENIIFDCAEYYIALKQKKEATRNTRLKNMSQSLVQTA